MREPVSQTICLISGVLLTVAASEQFLRHDARDLSLHVLRNMCNTSSDQFTWYFQNSNSFDSGNYLLSITEFGPLIVNVKLKLDIINMFVLVCLAGISRFCRLQFFFPPRPKDGWINFRSRHALVVDCSVPHAGGYVNALGGGGVQAKDVSNLLSTEKYNTCFSFCAS